MSLQPLFDEDAPCGRPSAGRDPASCRSRASDNPSNASFRSADVRTARPSPCRRSFCQPRCSGGNRAEPYTKVFAQRQLGQGAARSRILSQAAAAAPILGGLGRAGVDAPFASGRAQPYLRRRIAADSLKRSRPMSNLAVTDDLFFARTGMDAGRVERIVGEALVGHGRRRAVLRIQPVGKRRARRRPDQERRVRHDAGFRAARGRRRGGRLCACLRTLRGGDPARRDGGARRRERASGHARRAALRHQPRALHRSEPARDGRSRRQDAAAGRDRRLCPRPRPARQAGHGLALRRLAGGADHAPGRPPRRRYQAAGAAQRGGRGRRGRPHGNRLARRRRPRILRILSRSGQLEGAGRRGAAPGAGQSRLGAGPGRRDDRRARTGLARRHAARGRRAWARRRFQPQEDLDLFRHDRPARRGPRRHRRR